MAEVEEVSHVGAAMVAGMVLTMVKIVSSSLLGNLSDVVGRHGFETPIFRLNGTEVTPDMSDEKIRSQSRAISEGLGPGFD